MVMREEEEEEEEEFLKEFHLEEIRQKLLKWWPCATCNALKEEVKGCRAAPEVGSW